MSLAAECRRIAGGRTGRRLASGAAWSVGGSLVERLAALAGTIFVARLLGRATYGELAILASTLTTAAVFVGMGLGLTATRHVSELRRRDPLRLARILTLSQAVIATGGIVVTLGLWVAAEPIANDLLRTPQIAPYLALASLTVMLFAFDGFQTGAVIGFEALRGSALVTCGAAAVSLPLTVALAASFGLSGAVWGLVLSIALKCAAGRWLFERCLARDGIARFASHSGLEWRTLGGFALPAFLAVLLVPPAHWSCQTLLVRTPGGHDQLALLAVGMQWFQAVLFLPAAAGRIILPVLTDALADGSAGRPQRILWASVGATALLVVPAALFVGVLAPWLTMLYGASFSPAAPVLSVLVAAAALSALCAPFGQMLAARGQMWLGFGMNLLWATTYVVATVLLLERGAAGVALALLGAYALHSLGVAALAGRALRGSAAAVGRQVAP